MQKLSAYDIYQAERRTTIRDMIDDSLSFLHNFKKENLKTISEEFEKLINSALDAEFEAIRNKKRVNRWYKKNHGFNYFKEVNHPEGYGYFSFIYKYTDGDNFFFNDAWIRQEVIHYMLENEIIVYFGEIKHQGTPHKAWTTPRNFEILNGEPLVKSCKIRKPRYENFRPNF